MIYEDYKIGDARLVIWKIVESVDELSREMNLPENIAELEKIKTEKRKLEFLAARVALKNILKEEFFIFYTPEGKPFLCDDCYNISISHSGIWVAVMLHPVRHVGVDIECLNDKVQKVYTRFLSVEEQKDLSDGTDIRQLQIAWSGKEALYKIIGNDAVDFAHDMRIQPFNAEADGTMFITYTGNKETFQLYYIQNDEYTLVYCIS
ncbi:hypothetical protein D0T49_07320 [Paludibacter sp. 221]|uniref:4'-phosphopantetheinyl transferase family protein n=1 Tax=Paludibacter sp. 221 TaxID=2302939 RepID=UPI0013D781DD|nr:4'-phosphopantetheinyl transferase superfamily protein [Paludibacter sp. 221]NDV46856.1 hypothetical protein [Paludibacter sp. 221]